MTLELDADELALHDYQNKHFSTILPFILRHIIFYGAIAGTILSLIFYFWTYKDTIQERNFMTLHFNPPPTWSEVLLNCIVRIPLGALVGCVIAIGLGIVYAEIIQMTIRKQVSQVYIESFDLKLVLILMRIVFPIPVVILILIIETPVLWYANIERGIWFIAISYVSVCILLSLVRYRFLTWYIPPLLPPLS